MIRKKRNKKSSKKDNPYIREGEVLKIAEKKEGKRSIVHLQVKDNIGVFFHLRGKKQDMRGFKKGQQLTLSITEHAK